MNLVLHMRLREDYRSKTQSSRESLNKENLPVCCQTTVNTGGEHTAREEQRDLGRKHGAGMNQRPEEASCQKAIVQALVGGHVLGFGGKVRLERKRFQTCW